jgi:hypothetical protein
MAPSSAQQLIPIRIRSNKTGRAAFVACTLLQSSMKTQAACGAAVSSVCRSGTQKNQNPPAAIL